jgi:diguanylate cyclase (GGDEF)-like protein
MGSKTEVGTPARAVVRIAVFGMSLAVLALGVLAVWSAYATQQQSGDLTRVGVQTAGQLRALQALFVIRTETDAIEDDGATDERMARLREAQRILPEALARMESGDAPEAVAVARAARPIAARLDPAIERFLTDPMSDVNYKGDDNEDTAEDEMEGIVEELEVLLNDSESDPAVLLGRKLDAVNTTGTTVRNTALVLAPLGLVGVAACALLLQRYRRRSEAVMREAARMSAREARTDQLTGLPNRRSLLEELDRRIASGRSFTIALADLNGFKHYNDTFGHPAGDALLRRLGRKLATAWDGHGFAARLGGDEFCVISDDLAGEELQALLHGALSEQGEGFTISAVSGLAAVPTDADDANGAVRLADNRLYNAKAAFHGRHRSAAPAPLPDLLGQRLPELGEHLDRVAQLAAACAERLGLSADDVASIERAAQLHDIGKVAVPAGILAKRGDLTEEEHEFVRRHSLIGERLLSGDDSLEQVAAIVRATQERWDGTGYPDQLADRSIPIGSRIIAVADAFCAMTADRPHTPARSAEAALTELNRCAGTQFDPAVVATVAAVVASAPVGR